MNIVAQSLNPIDIGHAKNHHCHGQQFHVRSQQAGNVGAHHDESLQETILIDFVWFFFLFQRKFDTFDVQGIVIRK